MDEEDDVLQQLKEKMELFFKNNKVLEKKEDLDEFLEAIDLLEVWNNEEEKELVWQSLNKYNKKGKIDFNSALNGIKDLINQEEDQESHETILTHLSRRASTRDPQKGKFSISKLKQIAIDEYECVDNDTLIQIKKMLSLIKINKDSGRIFFNKIQEICNENKFIKITPEEIWKYLSFLSTDNNEGKTNMPMSIHPTLLTEIENFLNEKIPQEETEGENKENNNDNEEEDDSDEEEPTDILDKIINNSESIQEDSKVFSDMTKSLSNLTDDLVDKAQNILNGNDNSLEEILFVKDLINKKINELNRHNNKIEKQQNNNNKKMEKIQFYVNKLKNDLQTLEEDYKALNDKYENEQKTVNNNDEEVDRLFGENLMLFQDKEAKEKQIEELNKEKKEVEDKYNNLFAQLEKTINKTKEMQNEINDLKIKNGKYKSDYEDTLLKLINLEKAYNQELLKNEEEKKAKEEKDTNKDEDILSLFAKQQGIEIEKYRFMANKRKSQLISFPKTINIENETKEEKLAKLVKELEKMNEILKEKNKDNGMKIKELENIIKTKNDRAGSTLGKESTPNKLLNLNEIFNPSLYELYTERICLISDLSNFNPKKNKIVKKYNFSIGKPNIKKNKNQNILLSKQSSVEINYKGIMKQLKRQQTFNNTLNIISSNSSFNIKTALNIKKEKEKNKIQLTKNNFDINILAPKKSEIILEKTYSEFSIINKMNKKYNTKDFKIVKNSFNILKKLLIGKKREELKEDSKKVNLLFNDDSSAINKNKKLKIENTKEDDDDDFVGSISTKEVRSGTIMIHPKDLFESKDYYCLFQEEYVRRKLGHLKDVCYERNIYSDQVYVLVERKSLLKKYIMLSPLNFCIIEPNTLKFVYVDKIKNIKNIVLSNKNVNMILFRFSDGEDLLIESLRAYDLISYMKTNYFSNTKESIFRYEDKFIIKLKGQLHSLSVTDKILTNLLNFDGAVKVGYLSLYKGKFISSIFTETIGVLINIGLLLVEEATLKPLGLIPILGSVINKVEKERFGNNNCFEIILPSGQTKVFAVRKARERETWIAQFSKMKKEYEEKMKKIGVSKKVNTKLLNKLKGK